MIPAGGLLDDSVLEGRLRAAIPAWWINSGRADAPEVHGHLAPWRTGIAAAERRLRRCAPLLVRLFPELAPAAGIIESQVLDLSAMRTRFGCDSGRLLLKADHALPIAGSVKARGGIHAVLAVAERVAGLGEDACDRTALAGPAARALFAGHAISVGSTGNLGMSIGIAGRALGFRVVVHMSCDAKTWKKDRLRSLGAEVVEHAGDYLAACATARRQAEGDPRNHFIDDENSEDLFHGYAVAGGRLAAQLDAFGLAVGPDSPLVLHLPCGVGGAPGGIAVGARLALGEHVHVITAEPVQAPCMLLGLATGRHDDVGVGDLGLHGRTLADGLAVARPSRFVGRVIAPLVDACTTVDDRDMCRHAALAHRTCGLRLEPSGAAGFGSLALLLSTDAGRRLLARWGGQAVQMVWATGGSQLPEAEFSAVLAAGAD